ncbi:MAG: tetratricopeptide repeat protein [Candidatus Rokubacteria bacterium]|nr:tetratricopeptide repeat protein [Candidatus Rokubacteria bacterium]
MASSRALTTLALITAASTLGCATPYGTAQTALRQGRYEEAASRFQEVLTQSPDRLDALLGLGVTRYKLGAYDEAVAALGRLVAQAPNSETAHLYLGISHLQRGEEGPAAEHLAKYVQLKPGTRLAREVERARQLVRDERLSPALRAFVAGSLDAGADWEHDVREAREARLAAERAYSWRPFYPFYPGVGPCFVTRSGHLLCY